MNVGQIQVNKNLQGLNATDMAKTDEMKEYLLKRRQLTSSFDFENMLKLKIDEDGELELNPDDENEIYEVNPLFESVAQLDEALEMEASKHHKSKEEEELIKRTIMNINKFSISEEALVTSPNRRDKRYVSPRRKHKISSK